MEDSGNPLENERGQLVYEPGKSPQVQATLLPAGQTAIDCILNITVDLPKVRYIVSSNLGMLNVCARWANEILFQSIRTSSKVGSDHYESKVGLGTHNPEAEKGKGEILEKAI